MWALTQHMDQHMDQQTLAEKLCWIEPLWHIQYLGGNQTDS